MTGLKFKYRFAAVVLMSVIFSHITVFHFDLAEKVICIGGNNLFHIENVENNQIGTHNSFDFVHFENAEKEFCTDYKLDIHVDQNIVKLDFNFLLKFIKSFNPDFGKTLENRKLIIFTDKDFYTYNTTLENLSKVTLII